MREAKSTSTFNERVYEIVATIPKGRVVSYQQIAHSLNCRAYRAVGNALNSNSYPISQVPCHRVVKSNRELGGYAWDNLRKFEILQEEGVEFEQSSISLIPQKRVIEKRCFIDLEKNST